MRQVYTLQRHEACTVLGVLLVYQSLQVLGAPAKWAFLYSRRPAATLSGLQAGVVTRALRTLVDAVDELPNVSWNFPAAPANAEAPKNVPRPTPRPSPDQRRATNKLTSLLTDID
eukprot:TRINITY_DN26484_c0_g6_i1.p1 TRINITY_DN26484_c0_g6~~TRINITY_DN26484_c0_g6_i1.p1  ORF type:complete len:115 (+),score=4.96 TRINITY_DN26484_c0_g6_i1:131-475(+)